MTDRLRMLKGGRQISAGAIKNFAIEQGFAFREQWGRYLYRYSRKRGGREISLLIPATENLTDYDKRVVDVINTISDHLKVSTENVFREIVNSSFRVIRIIANEGEGDATLAYDSGIDLLRNGMKLIDSSANVVVSGPGVAMIRGRRPDAVSKYLDKVRIGQTEVGSFVVTLLMPLDFEATELGLPHDEFGGIGRAISDKFVTALKVAEDVGRDQSRMTDAALLERGLTVNFSNALIEMAKAVGSVGISVASRSSSAGSKHSVARFDHDSIPRLREVGRRLEPKNFVKKPEMIEFIRGTVVSISEKKGRSSGTIMLETDGLQGKAIFKLPFNSWQRDDIVAAFANKDTTELLVKGLFDVSSGSVMSEAIQFSLDERHRLT